MKKLVRRLSGWNWSPFMILYVKTPSVVLLCGIILDILDFLE